MKLIVVADDFTGASDTAAQLAAKGARCEVMLTARQQPSPRAEVLLLNTNSRASSARDAAQAVAAALQPWCQPGQPRPLLYKKIDSTLRGNPGAEIAAAMRVAGRSLAVIAAALPAAGRTTEHGECRVHQQPLMATEFASDPCTPVLSSRIRTLIARQSDLPVAEIDLQQVRKGGLSGVLARLAAQGPGMVVVDAVTDADLQRIARAALALPDTPLLVGSAGLAAALPAAACRDARQLLPVLVVAGSLSEVTRRQVEQVQRSGRAEIVDIDVTALLSPCPAKYLQALQAQASGHLARGRHCILRTSRTAQDRYVLAEPLPSGHQPPAALLCQQIGQLTRSLIASARIGGLILTGGDIAMAVASALGAQGFRIHGEVAPCVPCGTLINSEIDDLPVITKAGGLGSNSALCAALTCIEEMYQ